MSDPLIESVADTAFLIATHRALESERPDALVRDPFADKVAGEHGRRIALSLPRPDFRAWMVAIRTVIIDDMITAAIARGADTVLNLGAGLDTRPYRMDLPEALRWIEVDFASIQTLKESRLAGDRPRCALERVSMDLSDVQARGRFLEELAARSRDVLVVTEGVIPYLSNDDVGALAGDLLRTTPVRSWIVDYFAPEVHRFRKRMGRELENAPFKFEPEDWFGFFESHGWTCGEKRFLVDEGERRGRPIPPSSPLHAFLTPDPPAKPEERRAALREFGGYFRMVPTHAA